MKVSFASRFLVVVGLFTLAPSLAFSVENSKDVETESGTPKVEETTKSAAPRKPRLSDLSVDELDIYEHGEIGSGALVGGGLLGTFVGLGTGHIVYGYYTKRGWIFTIGELGSVGLMLYGITSGLTSCLAGDSHGCGNGVGYYVLGSLALLGFRIWEIIDVWTLPGTHNRRYRAIKRRLGGEDDEDAGVFVAPLIAGLEQPGRTPVYGLQLGWRF